LNINDNHFTLLEINEREKKIYHYDSMRVHQVLPCCLFSQYGTLDVTL
jgi:hypothetical protein